MVQILIPGNKDLVFVFLGTLTIVLSVLITSFVSWKRIEIKNIEKEEIVLCKKMMESNEMEKKGFILE